MLHKHPFYIFCDAEIYASDNLGLFGCAIARFVLTLSIYLSYFVINTIDRSLFTSDAGVNGALLIRYNVSRIIRLLAIGRSDKGEDRYNYWSILFVFVQTNYFQYDNPANYRSAVLK